MTILSAQSIDLRIRNSNYYKHHSPGQYTGRPETWLAIEPYFHVKKIEHGMSYGLTSAGYDIRLGKIGPKGSGYYELSPGKFLLAASLERVKVPNDLQVIVHDKSSWARKGLALQNTVLEPGWEGFITLELSNHGNDRLIFETGMPIAQLIFHQLDQPTEHPYQGKYQNQGCEPTAAIEESDNASQILPG